MLVALEAKSPDQSLNLKHSKAFMTASLIRKLDHSAHWIGQRGFQTRPRIKVTDQKTKHGIMIES